MNDVDVGLVLFLLLGHGRKMRLSMGKENRTFAGSTTSQFSAWQGSTGTFANVSD